MKALKPSPQKSSMSADSYVETEDLSIQCPGRLTLHDGTNRDFIFESEEDFQKLALAIIRKRAAEGTFYPSREEVDADREIAFKKLVEIYGTVTPEETKGMPSKDSIKALSDHFNRNYIYQELQKAYNEDIQLIEDLEYILTYAADDDISASEEIRDYVYRMALFILFERREYPKEGFDLTEFYLEHQLEVESSLF